MWRMRQPCLFGCTVVMGSAARVQQQAACAGLNSGRNLLALPCAGVAATSAAIPTTAPPPSPSPASAGGKGGGWCAKEARAHGPSIHLSHAGADQDLSGQPQGPGERQPVLLSRRQIGRAHV